MSLTTLHPGGCTQNLLHKHYGDGPWLCTYCGERVACGGAASKLGLTSAVVEHMVPRLRGGDNSRRNIVPACGSCNTSKTWTIYPDEWTPETGIMLDRIGEPFEVDPFLPLTPNALAVLEIVRRQPGQLDPRQVGRAVNIGSQAATTAIGMLVRAGRLRVRPEVRGNLQPVMRFEVVEL